jgi:hypothetical protein
MLPDNVLSTTDIVSPVIGSRRNSVISRSFTIDYEDGGIALNDPSAGLMYQMWTGQVIGNDVVLSAPSVSPTIIYTGVNITEISFTFDQNMRPTLAFVEGGQSKMLWYNPIIPGNEVTNISGSSPKVFLDDKRPLQNITSDILLAYIFNNNLCMRMQRDRYLIEYILKNITGRLITIGMGSNWRVQFNTIGS